MIFRAAGIESYGVDAVIEFANKPSNLGMDLECMDQRYIPGITVEGVKALEKPFNVPIVGDNESVTISTDWPGKSNADFVKRVVFTGMLPSEEVTVGLPLNRDLSIDEEDPSQPDELVDKAFDDFIELGGFLQVVIESSYADKNLVSTGRAELVIIETEKEFDIVNYLLETGISSAEIIAAQRLQGILGLLTRD